MNRRNFLLGVIVAATGALTVFKSVAKKSTTLPWHPERDKIQKLLTAAAIPPHLHWLGFNGNSAFHVAGNKNEFLPLTSALLIAERRSVLCRDYGYFGPEIGLYDGEHGRWFHIRFDHADSPERWPEQIHEAIATLIVLP